MASAIHIAVAHKETVRREGVQVKTNGDHQAITLTVRPAAGPSGFGDPIMDPAHDQPGGEPGNQCYAGSEQADQTSR